MFYSLKEHAGGLEHAARGLHRTLFRIPVTRYFDTLSKDEEPAAGEYTHRLKLLLDDGGKPVTCKGCGYAVVRMVYPDGWEVEVCSAVTAPKMVNDKAFDKWIESMPRPRVTSDVR